MSNGLETRFSLTPPLARVFGQNARYAVLLFHYKSVRRILSLIFGILKVINRNNFASLGQTDERNNYLTSVTRSML